MVLSAIDRSPYIIPLITLQAPTSSPQSTYPFTASPYTILRCTFSYSTSIHSLHLSFHFIKVIIWIHGFTFSSVLRFQLLSRVYPIARTRSSAPFLYPSDHQSHLPGPHPLPPLLSPSIDLQAHSPAIPIPRFSFLRFILLNPFIPLSFILLYCGYYRRGIHHRPH